MEYKIKHKRDGDSPVERNLQRDGQEGVEANIKSCLHCQKRKRSSQEQPGHDYFERRRRLVKLILIQEVKCNLNR